MAEIRNIVVLGRRNAGKSSLVNLLTGQQVSIVSPVKGTTTDPVRKRMELPGIGPCNIIDTAGVDDSGDVGLLRSSRSLSEAAVADLALLLFTSNSFLGYERNLAKLLEDNKVPFIIVHNQEDLDPLEEEVRLGLVGEYKCPVLRFTCLKKLSGVYMTELQRVMAETLEKSKPADIELVPESLAKAGDRVLLVCPIDQGAPEGRLILPQVMTLRALLDRGAVVTVIQPSRLKDIFRAESCSSPFDLVLTDSQAFAEVAAAVPEGIPVGSFSILMARLKGPFKYYLDSVSAISSLKDGDRVLILESCTHRTSCDDIGRVKLPGMLSKYTGKSLTFDFVSGMDPIPLAEPLYALAIQCGGCMATSRQIISRVSSIAEKGIPATNYGMAIAYMKGLFESGGFKAFLQLIGDY